jgi:hypothetical protein
MMPPSAPRRLRQRNVRAPRIRPPPVNPPWIVFGAFDRHNFGDLLLPHIVQALCPGRELVFAGLAARDLRAFGGHRVAAIAELAAAWGERPATLWHAGGEVLTCDAWTAAAMLLPPDGAPATIAWLGRDADARRAWVRRTLGTAAPAPYAQGAAFFRGAVDARYLGVGGCALDAAAPALRDAVLAALRSARAVTVRDRATLAQLHAAGVAARLIPDPAVMVAALFADRIRAAGAQGEIAELRRRHPQGLLALQISAEFGDDATLDLLAAELAAVQRDTGWGCALLRAGAAPWHDDLAMLRRLAARLPPGSASVVETLDIWAIAALAAVADAVAASSLHLRIVALAFGRPRVTLRSPASSARKHEAFVATWDAGGAPGVVGVGELAAALRRSLARAPAEHAAAAARAVAAFRHEWSALTALNGTPPPGV